jgi:peroxiredoxin Q/BCP
MSLKEGDKAPPFQARSDSGERISLKDLKGKPVVLYFYPKDMTPGCTQEACDFRDSFSRLKKLGVTVLGVSKDSVESHQKFKGKHELPFTLLADPDGELCKSYGVWKLKTLYGRKFMGIERATFVIGRDQRILKVYPKVKVKGHVDEILKFLITEE